MIKFLLLPCALLVCAAAAVAQENAVPRNVVKANMLSPLLRTGSFSFERIVGLEHGLQLSGSFTDFFVNNIEVRGFSVTPEYRHYLSDEPAPEGFHLGVFLRYQQLEYTIEGLFRNREVTQATTFGGGVVVGKQWLLKNRITLDIFGGPAYYAQRSRVQSDFSERLVRPGWYDGFGLRTGVTLGYAFGKYKDGKPLKRHASRT